MGDQNKVLSRPIFRRDANWDPFPNRTQPNHVFDQDLGLPPLLDSSDVNWIDWAHRRLASFSWPGCAHSPLPTPFSSAPPAASSHWQLSEGLSEIQTGQDSWKINLDVNHFSPEEITITAKEGYLEISGNHEERQDQHGSVARCFTRKYKLPKGVDLQHVSSSLSGDGVLSIEASIPGNITSHPPNDIVIPVQIRQQQEGNK